MSLEWWPALVFGWPGPLVAIALSVVGVVKARGVWLVWAMVVLLPFSVYLAANPRTEWGWLLPGIPLAGAYAVQRGSSVLGWLSVAALTGIVLWLVVIFFGSPRVGRTWAMVVAPQESTQRNSCRFNSFARTEKTMTVGTPSLGADDRACEQRRMARLVWERSVKW